MNKIKEWFAKNRSLAIAAAAVVVLVILGAGFFIVSSLNHSPSNQQASSAPAPTETPIPTIAPSSLGIALKEGPDLKTVILTISNTADLTAVSYELSYYATINGQQVSRGAIGDVPIKNPGQPVTESITMGTCSDVCHYDTGISNIQMTLKITKTDGKTYQSELSI